MTNFAPILCATNGLWHSLPFTEGTGVPPTGQPLLLNMRYIVRLLGTWFLGLAVVLLIIDGTKSLAANAIVVSSLEETWSLVHFSSLLWFENMVRTSALEGLWAPVVVPVLGWPGWVIFGVLGVVFAFFGRSGGNRIQKVTSG
jgi:hypothetical protein